MCASFCQKREVCDKQKWVQIIYRLIYIKEMEKEITPQLPVEKILKC